MKNTFQKALNVGAGLIALTGVLTLGACSAQKQAPKIIQLTGAGSTLGQPLYVAMADAYKKLTGVEMNFQGIGSGAGVQQLIAKTVDFGASDAPVNPDQQAKLGAPVVQIPTCVAAIVMSYNLPGLKEKLRLTGPVIADMYLGKIKKWNDAAIAKINPGVKLPATAITCVYRADASGTSYNFTGYLTKESPEWASKIGRSLNPKWPLGIGGKGSSGVAAYITQVPGGIGYEEIAYAMQNNLPEAIIQNKAGNWIDPSDISTVSQAANLAFPADGIVDLIDSTATNGYPISTTTWIDVYKDQTYTGNKDKSLALMNLLWYMLHDGQSINVSQGFAKLPDAGVAVAETLLKSVTYNGEPLLK
jgi:phosphate transport system substrate-binding protein